MAPRPIVLYDDQCRFCRWSLAKLLAWDRTRRLRPLPIGSEEGELLLAGLGAVERNASWHLIARDGRRRSAGSAVAPLLRELRGAGPAASLLERFPAATQRAYAWVADHRSTLSRLIPAGAIRRADARIERAGGAATP